MSHAEDDELTRKQRREQARSDRKAMEEAAVADAARRKRLTRLGVVVAVVVAAVVIILVATSGGGKTKVNEAHSTAGIQTTKEVDSLIGGIPQSGNTLGSPTAPVTLQYYGDLECPICQKFTLGALPALIRTWVREGKLRIEYRSLETATREPETFKAQQIAALAAGKQHKAWNYIETFYHEQGQEDSGYVTEEYLHKIAKLVTGLNLAARTKARSNSTYANEVEADAQSANAHNFNGTPSFLIGHTGGAAKTLEYSSLEDPSGFNHAIEEQLKA